MATTKKSPKAKTKTVKKPVKQTQAKAAVKAAKTTKKTAAKAVKKPLTTKAITTPAKKVTTKKSSLSALTKLHIVSAVVSVAGAVAAALLMGTQKVAVYTGLLAKDELTGATIPAVKHVYDLELRWLVMVIMALAAVYPILLLTRFKARYQTALTNKVSLIRWIDLAVISALMIEVVALLSGVQDLMTLKLISGLLVVTCLLSWVAEKRNAQAGRLVKSEAYISVLTGALPWLLIAVYAVSTYVHGMITSPWYVYALYVAVLGGFFGIGNTLIKYIRRAKNFTDYEAVERRYVLTSILTKLAFAAILISGLRK